MHYIISLFLLAHSSFAATLAKRALAPDSTLPSGREYSECYTDSVYSRTLNSDFVFDVGINTLTADTCIAYCSSMGYPVAGTEYAAECFCGTGIPLQTGTDGCNMACAGDSTLACGGPDRLSVYANFATNPGPEGWASLGCYTDNVQARTLANLEQVAGGTDALTVALCTTTCGNLGFTYAGVEYAGKR
ncbi:WSC-domain-containing protein [Corynespora cassiicola Philippines]|uniref:WSC-domain-containing protein n=1 Tax=Corynespora cassiicola Philippines TaxID=1448308 RepID=A0A2T2NYH0_CORCC|nr:WSC-domain-containing protein [Corynespora cassiicola Philippines]